MNKFRIIIWVYKYFIKLTFSPMVMLEFLSLPINYKCVKQNWPTTKNTAHMTNVWAMISRY